MSFQLEIRIKSTRLGGLHAGDRLMIIDTGAALQLVNKYFENFVI